MKKILLVIILLVSFYFILSRCTYDSEYVENFDWMVKTFTENDAGFKFYLEDKGLDSYTKHTESYRDKIKNAKSEQEFLSLMNDWLYYFRKGHIGVILKETKSWQSLKGQVKLNENELLQYLKENKDSIHFIEGLWGSYYTIGIIRSEKNKNQFNVFIPMPISDSLLSLKDFMPINNKIVELTLQKDGTFKMEGHPSLKKAELIGDSNNIFDIGGQYWERKYPETHYSLEDSILVEFTSGKPFIKQLSKSTIYFRIPSFNIKQKEAIDSLLNQNDKLIRSTENLIIDIRNGTGGSDYSFNGLIPYFYAQPIRTMGLLYFATELNALAYENYAKMFKDTNTIKKVLLIAKEMRDSIGSYIGDDSGVSIYKYSKTSKYPDRVAIICNKNNASTDEALLYTARQSYKVKIFGEPTRGALDFSNINIVDFPNGKYVLYLTMTVSNRYPEYRIDDIGIQPDYFIDDNIPAEDWVEYVQSVIEAE